jgi:hypothetical protein
MMFSFSGDTHRGGWTYAGSASGLNFLLYAMSVVVTGTNIQSSNKDTPWILNELEEGTELRMGGAGSHCTLALAMRLRPEPARCVDRRVVFEIAIKVENSPRFPAGVGSIENRGLQARGMDYIPGC